MNYIKFTIVVGILLFVNGCTFFPYWYSHTNIEKKETAIETKASFHVIHDRGSHENTLVILVLSGGGSRAAYWSASIMLALEKVFENQNLDILKEVDIISSVSGGSLPAAYYVISKDPEVPTGKVRSERIWRADIVKELMTRNYKGKWFGNWFWPNNILKYWFTAFDRSDIMAQTFADNLYDVAAIGTAFGKDLKFKDINPERPYIVLNSTNGTRDAFAEVFPFTEDRFDTINSDIGEYEISRAVMATAAFPAAFNYMTLKDYNASGKKDFRFVHIFDGGNADNLGLKSAIEILETNKDQYNKFVLILIDAYTKNTGVDGGLPDARKALSFAVDLNFLDSLDTLLANNHDNLIDKTIEMLEGLGRQPVQNGKKREYLFYHVRFEDILDLETRQNLNRIKTDFKIMESHIHEIDTAVKTLMVEENDCLGAIKDILMEEKTEHQISYCIWQN